MSKAAVSVFCFGLYLAGGGLVLVLVPEQLCRVLGIDDPDGPWVRITGMFFLLFAYYCLRAALEEERRFMHWSLRTRPTTIFFLAGLVAFELAPPVILVFGVFDVAATLWTALALRGETKCASTLT